MGQGGGAGLACTMTPSMDRNPARQRDVVLASESAPEVDESGAGLVLPSQIEDTRFPELIGRRAAVEELPDHAASRCGARFAEGAGNDGRRAASPAVSHARKVWAVAVLAALGWAVAPVAQAQPPIRIGATLSQTGLNVTPSQNILRGYQLCSEAHERQGRRAGAEA